MDRGGGSVGELHQQQIPAGLPHVADALGLGVAKQGEHALQVVDGVFAQVLLAHGHGQFDRPDPLKPDPGRLHAAGVAERARGHEELAGCLLFVEVGEIRAGEGERLVDEDGDIGLQEGAGHGHMVLWIVAGQEHGIDGPDQILHLVCHAIDSAGSGDVFGERSVLGPDVGYLGIVDAEGVPVRREIGGDHGVSAIRHEGVIEVAVHDGRPGIRVAISFAQTDHAKSQHGLSPSGVRQSENGAEAPGARTRRRLRRRGCGGRSRR